MDWKGRENGELPTYGIYACGALMCENRMTNKRNIIFHRFPRDEERCKEWLVRAGRLDLLDKPIELVHSDMALCEAHFEKDCYCKSNCLRSDAVPTIFKHNTYTDSMTFGENSEDGVPDPGTLLQSFDHSYCINAKEIVFIAVNDSNTASDSRQNEEEGVVFQESTMQDHSYANDGILDAVCEEQDIDSGEVVNRVIHPYTEAVFSWDEIPSQICRLCACTNESHPKQSVIGWMSLLDEVIPGLVHLNDGLPQHMCKPCANKLYTCAKIKSQFIEADTKLQETLGFIKSAGYNIETVNSDSEVPVNTEMNEEDDCSYYDLFDDNGETDNHHEDKEYTREATDTWTEIEENEDMNVEESVFNSENSSEIVIAEVSGCQDNKVDRSFSQKHKLIDHIRCHTNEKPFICEYCGESFRLKESFENHQLRHNPPSYSCSECDKKFHSNARLTKHKKTHITDTRFICDLCGKVLSSKSILEGHVRSHLGEKPYQCTVCGLCYSSTTTLASHMYCHSTRTFICEICGKVFKRKKALNGHMNCHTKVKTCRCPICLKTFSNNHNRSRHLKVTCKNIICVVCYKTFLTRDTMEEHRTKEHSVDEINESAKEYRMEQILHCEVCLVSVTGTSNMLKHMRTAHETCSLYACEQCNRCFLNEQQLLQHGNPCRRKKVPSNYLKGPRAKCKVCSEHVFGICNMLKHVRRVHKEYRPYSCEHCSKSFLTKEQLGQHSKSHSDNRPFACTICHRRFKSKHALRSHDIAFHQDIFPFHCPHCDRKFNRQTTLIAHKRTHTGERPYPCSICGKAFAHKIDMQRHTKTHSGIKKNEN
ncbi:zinc finger protein 93-like isoform X2 [Periplaneta americana]